MRGQPRSKTAATWRAYASRSTCFRAQIDNEINLHLTIVCNGDCLLLGRHRLMSSLGKADDEHYFVGTRDQVGYSKPAARINHASTKRRQAALTSRAYRKTSSRR